MSFQVLVGLILCNVIWAANPIMAKILLETFEPSQVAWIRYSSATVFYLLFVSSVKTGNQLGLPVLRGGGEFFARPRVTRDLLLLLGVGGSAFCFAPLVGLAGLHRTGAIDNALLIAMEPLVTVLLAILFLGERLSRAQFFSFTLALLGFGFLSGLAFTRPSQWFGEPSIVGNLILVVSLAGEAGYSIFARRLAGRFPMTQVFGSALILGFGALSLAVLSSSSLPAVDSLLGMSSREWLAVLWLGPFGSTLTYLYWLVAIERTAVSSAALTLFVQPIVGALLGALVLGESMTVAKWLGGGMILFAVGLLTPRRQNS